MTLKEFLAKLKQIEGRPFPNQSTSSNDKEYKQKRRENLKYLRECVAELGLGDKATVKCAGWMNGAFICYDGFEIAYVGSIPATIRITETLDMHFQKGTYLDREIEEAVIRMNNKPIYEGLTEIQHKISELEQKKKELRSRLMPEEKEPDEPVELIKNVNDDEASRLKVLLYNAVMYMTENGMDADGIAEYLGSDIEELRTFNALEVSA